MEASKGNYQKADAPPGGLAWGLGLGIPFSLGGALIGHARQQLWNPTISLGAPKPKPFSNKAPSYLRNDNGTRNQSLAHLIEAPPTGYSYSICLCLQHACIILVSAQTSTLAQRMCLLSSYMLSRGLRSLRLAKCSFAPVDFTTPVHGYCPLPPAFLSSFSPRPACGNQAFSQTNLQTQGGCAHAHITNT